MFPRVGKEHLLLFLGTTTLVRAFTLLEPAVEIPYNPDSANSFLDARGIIPDHRLELQDPYEAWESHNLTEPYEFWHRTPDTIKTSDTVEFYKTFLDDYNTKDSRKCKEKGMGEFNCFAWIYTGDSNFACGIDTTYMCRKPSSIEVMTHISKHWRGAGSMKELVNLGRQAYFTSELVQTLMAKDFRFFSLISTVETEALGQTTDIVKAFTPQIDGLRLKVCELNKMLTGLTVAASILAIQGASGYFMESIYPGVPPNPAVNTFVQSWAGWTQNALRSSYAYYASWNAPITTDPKNPALGEYPELNLMLTRAEGVCGNTFGVVVDDNIDHESKLTNYIVKYTSAVRERLDREFRTLMFYNGTNAAHSSFSAFQKLASNSQFDLFDQSVEQITQQISQSFKEVLASKLLAGARSYMKCEERADAVDTCAYQYKSQNPKLDSSRYCPPNTNVRCQMARWTFQGKNNHEDFVAGFMEGGFDRYGISPQALMENSWRHYQNNRGGKRDWREVLDKHDLNNRDELLHLPVCVSSVKTIEDIWPSTWNFETSHWREGFPFSCGDHTSNETVSFLNDININPFKENELWHTTLPKYLNRIPKASPARSYNLLCRLGARWPVWQSSISRFDSMDWIRPNSIDSHCGQFMNMTQGMDEWESNWALCESEEMKWTLSTEHPWIINVVPNPKSHKRHCKSWKKENKQEIEGQRGEMARRKHEENKSRLENQGVKILVHNEKLEDGVPQGVEDVEE